ncbi:MAG: nucleoside hydrolase [Hormoscilla sp.]
MQVLIGSVSDDLLVANANDTLVGVLGDDTLDASTGGGRNRLFGQEGDDLLLAGSNDRLVGGPGNDRLFAGSGRGVLVGGEGADQFWIIDGELPSRVNVIRDFTQGTDILGIRGLTPAEVRSLTVSQLNARDTLVQVAGENVAILRNTVARDLTMDDFFIAPPPPPLPEVGFSVEPEVVAEGARAIISFELSGPAPAGGLEVIWIEDDPDDANDADILVEESTNIIDFQPLTGDDAPEGGAVVTIAEGATAAELVVQTLADDEQESDETAFVTLQSGEGYIVDPDNDTISLTITDAPAAIPLIVDDDGSQDGMTALAYMLQNPQFSVEAITISQGLARPQIFGDNVMRMLTRLDVTGIPVGLGSEAPLAGDNTYPEPWRDATDIFWAPTVQLPEEALETVDERDAADLIIDTVNESPEPVAILSTGSLTNIAEALRRDPEIVDNIAVLQIMGGAVFVEGNLREAPDPEVAMNEVAEWNIWVDPVAAAEVFAAGSEGLEISLTPLDATNQINITRADQDAWEAAGTPESLLAAEFLDVAFAISGDDPLIPNPVWDLVAAINLSEPDFSAATPLHIEVDTESLPNDTQGQLVVNPDLPPNVNAYLDPSFDNLGFGADMLFRPDRELMM